MIALKNHHPYILGFITITSLVLSLFVFNLFNQWQHSQVENRFKQASTERTANFKRVVDIDLQSIRSVGAFYHASELVTRDEFYRFTLPLLNQSLAAQAFSWIPQVSIDDKHRYEIKAQNEGLHSFYISEQARQGDMVPVAKRELYFPVYYIEPLVGNEAALGFDLASNEQRRRTLDIARDSGELQITPRITLVQENKSSFSFLAVLPVYSKRLPIISLEERRNNLQGFITGPFRVNVILRKAIEQMDPVDIEFSLFDTSAPEDQQFLAFYSIRSSTNQGHHHMLLAELLNQPLMTRHKLDIGNREWMLITTPREGHYTTETSPIAWGLLSILIALSTVMTGFVALLLMRYEQIKRDSKDIAASKVVLEYQASHDALTTLVNRRELEKRLQQTLLHAQYNRSSHALLYLDLDQFKIVNDTCGHAAGDNLLKQISQKFRQRIRDRDTLARIGGDEFAIILENCDMITAVNMANELIKNLKQQKFYWREKTFDIGVSIGAIQITSDRNSIQELMDDADMALYMAKERGRNRVHTLGHGDKVPPNTNY